MAEQRILTEAVSPIELQQIIKNSQLRWVYAERQTETLLAREKDFRQLDLPFETWEHGRAFDETAEIAWWRTQAGYQVRTILGEGSTLKVPGVPDSAAEMYLADQEETILLLGEHDQDKKSDSPSWSTARIPRYLHYPVDIAPPPLRAALALIRYRRNGIFSDQRFVRVQSGVKDNG